MMTQKVKILFIVPPNVNKLVMERNKEVTEAYGTYPPLSVLYLATYIKEKLKNKISVKIADCSLGDWTDERFRELVLNYNPDVVGATVFTPTLIDSIHSMQQVKKIKPNCITIIGGAHVTFFQERAILSNEFDYGIMGFGEYPMTKFIEAIFFGGSLNEVPGLIYKIPLKDQKHQKNNPKQNRTLAQNYT